MTKTRAKPNRWSMGKPVLSRRLSLPESIRLANALRDYGIRVRVKNRGHHWVLTRGGRKVEWWPATRKLVVDQRWKEGVAVSDVFQMAIATHHVLAVGGTINWKFISRWTEFRKRIRRGQYSE